MYYGYLCSLMGNVKKNASIHTVSLTCTYILLAFSFFLHFSLLLHICSLGTFMLCEVKVPVLMYQRPKEELTTYYSKLPCCISSSLLQRLLTLCITTTLIVLSLFSLYIIQSINVWWPEISCLSIEY